MDLNSSHNKKIEKVLNNYISGKQEAFSEILSNFVPTIQNLSKKYIYFFPHLSKEELIEEGIEGLYKAIEEYKKKKKKTDFYKLAKYHIKKNIRDYVLEDISIIKIPIYILRKVKKVFDLINKEKCELKNIAKKAKTDTEEIKKIILSQQARFTSSVDQYIDLEEKESLQDILSDESKTYDEIIINKFDEEYLYSILEKLTPQEKEVLELRWGLKDKKSHSIKFVAEKLNIPEQKVKFIEKLAIEKLKNIAKEES
jgi:RNA polymerase sigma factor (sigma-70 family)